MPHSRPRRGTRLPGALLLPLALLLLAAGPCDGLRFRSVDGRFNQPGSPDRGRAGDRLARLLSADYADGMSEPAGATRPGARAVSNAVAIQTAPLPAGPGPSSMLWQWGQFVDHDLDLSGPADPPEPFDVPCPAGDPFFDPLWTGAQAIPLDRSEWDPASGVPGDPRQQRNAVTAWIDASMVYGSDPVRARALRTLDGSGRLRTSPGRLLPFNTLGLPNAGGDDDPGLFLAGDVRANEQVGLTSLHVLFVREHNRLARILRRRHPRLDGDEIYQLARRHVGALVQRITYREFLPALLGPHALPPYRGWDPRVDPRIRNAFATAAFRLGHSMLNPFLLRLDAAGAPIPQGPLPLRDAFFAPERILLEGGIDPLLRGLAAQRAQVLDVQVVDDVRNFLFGPPGAGGFDLAALNIQRGRDHGLPGYNDAREAMGLARRADFAEVSSDPEVRARLAVAYDRVDDVDLWVGGLAEDPLPGGLVGELFAAIVAEQFTALRAADRFWYQRALPRRELRRVEATSLADVIRRNTRIGSELPEDVFHAG